MPISSNTTYHLARTATHLSSRISCDHIPTDFKQRSRTRLAHWAIAITLAMHSWNLAHAQEHLTEAWSIDLGSEWNGQAVLARDSFGNITAGHQPVQFHHVESTHLRKYDPLGNELWTTSLQSKRIGGIAIDGDDNIFLTGGHVGFLTYSWVAKYSPNGDELWSHNLSTDDVRTSDLTLDEGGNIFLTGQIGDPRGTAYFRPFAGKLSATGQLVWQIDSLGFSERVRGKTLDLDSDGNVYLVGESFETFEEDHLTITKPHVTKINPVGNVVWNLPVDVQGTVSDIMIDSQGSIFITGNVRGLLGDPQYAEQYVFVSRIDRDGNVLWTEQFGAGDTNHSGSLAEASDGTFFVTGTHRELFPHYTSTGFIRKYTTSGELLWEHVLDDDLNRLATLSSFDPESREMYVSGSIQASIFPTGAHLTKFNLVIPEPGTSILLLSGMSMICCSRNFRTSNPTSG